MFDLFFLLKTKQFFRTRYMKVNIGNISLGDDCEVLVQTMTNTDTNNIEETVEQCIEVINKGAKLVRITAQTEKEAEKLGKIKAELVKKGYNTPIIADIHFKPKAALLASQLIEKVRINPGNYTNLTGSENIESKLIPLINSCKKNNTVIRIGSNYGSLSKQILEKYGNTALGMVEAAYEFIDVCTKNNFKNIVVSMKAGDARIMIESCRLLQNRMIKNNLVFPQHLGVTEAGNGIEARIKSAIGIGTLLSEGIGDTIRVSLTEAPVREIPIAQKIVDIFSFKKHNKVSKFNKIERNNILLNNKFSVINNSDIVIENSLSADFVYTSNLENCTNVNKNYICNSDLWSNNKRNIHPLFSTNEYINSETKSDSYNFVEVIISQTSDKELNLIDNDKTSVIVVNTDEFEDIFSLRNNYYKFISKIKNTSVILKRTYNTTDNSFILKSSGELGSLLIDKLADGIWIINNKSEPKESINISFGILQATKLRITKTEFISCPTCGRTKFNIEQITQEVKRKTSHLKGLKIAVMGCVVNGPGEMADADYGYVGSSANKIHLYKGQDIVKKNIPQENALDELINLIKSCNDWT